MKARGRRRRGRPPRHREHRAAPRALASAALLAGLIGAGCRGGGQTSGPGDAATNPIDAARPIDAKREPSIDATPPPPVLEPLLAPGREGEEDAALDALSAIPAWDAVVRRGEYLARRGAGGVIYGRLGDFAIDEPQDTAAGQTERAERAKRPASGQKTGSSGASANAAGAASTIDAGAALGGDASEGATPNADDGPRYRWLLDDTAGRGSLGVRIAIDPALPVQAGQRLAVWGAWHVDEARRWYWRADRVASLPTRETEVDEWATPGHEIARVPAPPQGAVPVSEAQEAGEIVFAVRAGPVKPGDGWEIADSAGRRAVAILTLPGEQASYGGQDLRTADERWTLSRKALYTVRIRRFRAPKNSNDLKRLRAISAPRQIAR